MRINYDKETDFTDAEGVESHEVKEGVVLDFDADGNLTGVDIQHASQKLDLNSLEMDAFLLDKARLVS